MWVHYKMMHTFQGKPSCVDSLNSIIFLLSINNMKIFILTYFASDFEESSSHIPPNNPYGVFMSDFQNVSFCVNVEVEKVGIMVSETVRPLQPYIYFFWF